MKCFCIKVKDKDEILNINIDVNKVKSWFIYKNIFIFVRYKDMNIDIVYFNDVINKSKIASIILFFKMTLRNKQCEWDINFKESQLFEFVENKQKYYCLKKLTGAFVRK